MTSGAGGVFFRHEGEIWHQPAFLVDAIDTLGAGDTWHGAFALALAEGQSERERCASPRLRRRSNAPVSAAATARRAVPR